MHPRLERDDASAGERAAVSSDRRDAIRKYRVLGEVERLDTAAAREWELVERLNDIDIAEMSERPEFSEWFTPDFVREDRRGVIGAPAVDAAGFVDQLQAWFEIGEGAPTFRPVEVVAVAGERLVVIRISVGFSVGGEVEMLHVVLFDEEVRRQQRTVSFDVDERDLAVEELGRLAAGITPSDATTAGEGAGMSPDESAREVPIPDGVERAANA